MIENKGFSKGSHFEQRLVQSLIIDHKFAEQMIEVLDLDYFGIEYLKKTVKILFTYYGKYNAFPSFNTLKCVVDKFIDDGILKEQITSYLENIKKNPLNGDLEFIKEESLDFCRKRKLIIALGEATNLIEERKYDDIHSLVQKALLVGSERDLGHNFIEDFESRMIPEIRNPIPTPWVEINKLLRSGGPSGGELCCIAAPTGIGKSHILVDCGAAAAKSGKTVAHYTFELSEKDVANRYDANISEIPFDDLIKRKEEVKEKISNIPGKIFIKSFPTKSCGVMSIRNHLNRLRMRDVIPDLIVIDYASLMKSQKNYKEKRFENECIFEDLRGLGMEFGIPIWTAHQTNRESIEEEVITLKHIAEAFVIAMVCDFFITFNVVNRQQYLPTDNKLGNLYLAKSRLGVDGLVLPSTINTSMSKLNVLKPEENDTMENGETQEDKLKRRLRELKNKD